jgi:hypothetical protein
VEAPGSSETFVLNGVTSSKHAILRFHHNSLHIHKIDTFFAIKLCIFMRSVFYVTYILFYDEPFLRTPIKFDSGELLKI